MATDATGTPTALGIPKFNTSVDAPSGLGGNAQMDSIDALLQAHTSFQTAGIVLKGNKLLSTDTQPAFQLLGDGTLKWGPGGSTATDTTLNRTGVGVLRLTGTFNATAGIQLNGTPIVSSAFGRTGAVVATSGDYTVAQVTGAAPLASPALTGTPTAPTQLDADNSTAIATTAWVRTRISASSVSSVFGRTGAVVANSGDYTAAQVTNAFNLAGSGNVQTSAGGGFGYGTGAGGAVTQLTSLSTAVTLNKPTGQITTFTSAVAGGSTNTFTVNCSVCASTDTIVLSWASTGAWPSMPLWSQAGSGGFLISYYNPGGLTSSSQGVINYTIVKGSAS